LNEIEFAKSVISGQVTLPNEPVMQALLIHQSIDSLCRIPFDARKTQEYIQVFKDAENSIAQLKQREGLEEMKRFEDKVRAVSQQISEILIRAFRWRNTRTNEQVSLRGKTKWVASHLISGQAVSSSGLVDIKQDCPCEGEEFSVSPLLDDWLKDYASNLVREGQSIPSQAKLYQDFTKYYEEGFSVKCNRANPLLSPREACSVFITHSYVALRCTPLILLLEPVG